MITLSQNHFDANVFCKPTVLICLLFLSRHTVGLTTHNIQYVSRYKLHSRLRINDCALSAFELGMD